MNLEDIIEKNKINVEEVDGEYVYLLFDNKEVVYVGRSTKNFPSLANHKEKQFTHFSCIDIEQLDFPITQEELFFKLIFDYVPRYNTSLPSNNRYMSKGMIKKHFDITGVELNRLIRKNNVLPIYREYYDIRDIFNYQNDEI